jgi:hypothetical protein
MTKRGDTPKDPRFLVLVRGGGKKDVYIMATDDGVVQGFVTDKDAKDYFLHSYESGYSRSYVGSMSACIHFLQYQPRVVGFKDLDDIKQRIASDPPRLVSLWGEAGGMKAVTCRPEAYDIWDKAESVPLISNRRAS